VFDDVRLPEEIEQGSTGGPAFLTTVVSFSLGNEQRNANWPAQRCVYDISYGIQSKDDYVEVVHFFYARQGRARGFRFKDWSDYQSNLEFLGTGDGAEQDFQLVKNYTSLVTYARKITRPVDGTITVYKDGVVQPTGWILQTGGIIHFSTAPADGVEITAEFDFDVPVRFNSDALKVNMALFNAGSIESIELVEIRE
jgi:uncharacterized protein (TIGR02217 family)